MGSVNGPILLTGALNWKSADNLSVNMSYFKADHCSRNTRLMFGFVILNLHLLDSRSWGEEEKEQLVVKGCGAEETSFIPLLPSSTVTSAPGQNGEKRGGGFPRLGKFSLVAKSRSSPHQLASDLCSMVLCSQKCTNWWEIEKEYKGSGRREAAWNISWGQLLLFCFILFGSLPKIQMWLWFSLA